MVDCLTTQGHVSVVVASYNHAPYIEVCLDSVTSQTYPHWSLLVVDDASTDGTPDVIRQWLANHPTWADRLTMMANPMNQGQYATLQQGINQTQGEYLAILNSDDAFTPDKLTQQVNYLTQHPDKAAVFTGVKVIDHTGNPLPGHRYHGVFNLSQWPADRFGWQRQFFMDGNRLCHPSVVIRQTAQQTTGAYDPRMANTADHEYWVRLLLHHDIGILPDALTCFRVLPGEGNMGGQKPASKRRHAWERQTILDHFLSLSTVDALYRMLPDLAPIAHAPIHPTWDVTYLLAQYALTHKPQSSAHVRFALHALHRLMADPHVVSYWQQHYQFGYPQWIQLAGQFDPFNVTGPGSSQTKPAWYRRLWPN
jgi:glycosyltransferase involved in cell wall biosynthesis